MLKAIKLFIMKKRQSLSFTGNLVIFFLTILSIVTLYISCSSFWVDIGGINVDDRQILFFEPFFVVVLSIIFFFPRIRSSSTRYLLPLTPILIFYLSFDIFYSFLKRAPHPSDLRNIYTIFDFYPLFGIVVILLILITTTILLLLLTWSIARRYSSGEILISLLYRFAFCLIAVFLLFSGNLSKKYTETFNYIDWSQERTIRNNGRFSSFVYYWMQEKQNKAVLNSFSKNYISKNIDIYKTLYSDSELIRNRNIHIIVLESFLDPRLIENATFNPSPLSQELVPFMLDGKRFSLVTSPVYGGRTAQAEFELLAGVQALAKIDSIEFNVMLGKEASSFIKKLTDSGYESIATIASSSGYFNSKQAYKSLGFNKITFLKDIDKFHDPAWMPIFDTDVFQYHVNDIENMIKSKEKPIVSYILGMYGHFPYETDQQKQPDVIEVKHEDDRLKKIANQFFYRTQAVAEYIKHLLSIDPDSIIYITSDHLPPILWDGTKYKLDQQVNVSLLLDAGKPVDISGAKYFQVPLVIWNILTGKNRSHQIDDDVMENLYFKFLSESTCK